MARFGGSEDHQPGRLRLRHGAGWDGGNTTSKSNFFSRQSFVNIDELFTPVPLWNVNKRVLRSCRHLVITQL
jgi:hypothetical protein